MSNDKKIVHSVKDAFEPGWIWSYKGSAQRRGAARWNEVGDCDVSIVECFPMMHSVSIDGFPGKAAEGQLSIWVVIETRPLPTQLRLVR